MLHPTHGGDEKLRRKAAEALGAMGLDAVKQEEVMLARTLELDAHASPIGALTEGHDIMDHTQPMVPQLKELFDQMVGESGEIVTEDVAYAYEDEEIQAFFKYLLV